jgi:hypothetical protein
MLLFSLEVTDTQCLCRDWHSARYAEREEGRGISIRKCEPYLDSEFYKGMLRFGSGGTGS